MYINKWYIFFALIFHLHFVIDFASFYPLYCLSQLLKLCLKLFNQKLHFWSYTLYLKGFIFQKVFFSLDEHEAKKIISVNIMKQDFARNIIHSFCSESVLGTGRASTGNIGLGGWIEISVHHRRGGVLHYISLWHLTVRNITILLPCTEWSTVIGPDLWRYCALIG